MTLMAAMLVGLSAWLLVPASPRHRWRRLVAIDARPAPSLVESVRGWAPMLAAAALVVLLGWPFGVVAGGVALVLVPRLLARLQSAGDAARVTQLTRQLPDAIDLLAAMLRAGAPIAPALAAVALAQDEPMGSSLSQVASSIEIGVDIDQAWLLLGDIDGVDEVAAAMRRSQSTGAPIAATLALTASELRRRHEVRMQVAARRAGVHALLPLALCFLPAFVLLAAVPVVVALASSSGLITGLLP